MKLQNITSYFFKLLRTRRIFILVFLVLGIYLLRFVNNLQELHAQGEALPTGITGADLEYANCVVNNLNDSPNIISCPRP
jgi:hypothetical protein